MLNMNIRHILFLAVLFLVNCKSKTEPHEVEVPEHNEVGETAFFYDGMFSYAKRHGWKSVSGGYTPSNTSGSDSNIGVVRYHFEKGEAKFSFSMEIKDDILEHVVTLVFDCDLENEDSAAFRDYMLRSEPALKKFIK